MRTLIFNPAANAASNTDKVRIVTNLAPLLHSAETRQFDAVIIPKTDEFQSIASQLRSVCDSAILLLIDAQDFETSKIFVEDCVVDGLVFTDKLTFETEALVLTSLEAGKRAEQIMQLEDEIEQLEMRVSSFQHGKLKTTRFIINKATRLVSGISTISTILYYIIRTLWN